MGGFTVRIGSRKDAFLHWTGAAMWRKSLLHMAETVRCARKNLIAVRVDGGPRLEAIYRPVVLYMPVGFGEGTQTRSGNKKQSRRSRWK
jgi:hypothetical protein